ncbi:MAG: exo-alpha-sialidase [Acidobacteria bacterium]|nr:exo-alpha-sialidase [Acidobacteriota bacterium]
MRAVSLALLFAGSLLGWEAELVSVDKIWDRAPHQAFTDLIRFQDRWYATFREADGHVRGDGRLRVITSADGSAWESAALLEESGIDLRDPKLSETPDGRLMLTAGGSTYRNGELVGRRPRVFFSADGRGWTAPEPVLAEGDWLWRTTWHNGRAWGVSYTKDGCTLYSSGDGRAWTRVTDWDVPGCTEVTVRFTPDGEMWAMVRRDRSGDDDFGWIGTAHAPYRSWTWNKAKERFGGPDFERLPDGSWIAGSRHYGDPTTTVVARLGRDSYEPLITLPSGGDTSYPGLVYHDGTVWFSFYASQEGKTNVYLAKIRLR